MSLQSKLEITSEKKVEIITKLLESSRAQIMTWHNQAYIAASASLGVILLATNYWITASQKTRAGAVACVFGIVTFSVVTQLYLHATQENYNNNEKHKLKCEYALKLKDENEYFSKARFYWAEEGEMERGMPAKDIYILRWSHAITSVILAIVCLLSFLGR